MFTLLVNYAVFGDQTLLQIGYVLAGFEALCVIIKNGAAIIQKFRKSKNDGTVADTTAETKEIVTTLKEFYKTLIATSPGGTAKTNIQKKRENVENVEAVENDKNV